MPEGVAARIEVNTGVGGVNADSDFTSRDNVYESSGYNSEARNKVDLKLDAGVGSVDIRKK